MTTEMYVDGTNENDDNTNDEIKSDDKQQISSFTSLAQCTIKRGMQYNKTLQHKSGDATVDKCVGKINWQMNK